MRKMELDWRIRAIFMLGSLGHAFLGFSKTEEISRQERRIRKKEPLLSPVSQIIEKWIDERSKKGQDE
jgi:hypothetical protein